MVVKIKDHGVREEMATGSKRDTQAGKPRPELIPASVLIKLGLHYGAGSEKYGDWNWSKGQPISRYMASMSRHFMYFMAGMTDEPHLIAMIWNAISIDYTLDAIKCGVLPKELDDRHDSNQPDNPIGQELLKVIEQNIQDKLAEQKPSTPHHDLDEFVKKFFRKYKEVNLGTHAFVDGNGLNFPDADDQKGEKDKTIYGENPPDFEDQMEEFAREFLGLTGDHPIGVIRIGRPCTKKKKKKRVEEDKRIENFERLTKLVDKNSELFDEVLGKNIY